MAEGTVQRTGLRLFLEGVVVLLSILTAFFLEGWRDDRQLSQEVRQELAGVNLEVLRNREAVEAELDAIRRVATGASLLVDAMEAADGADVVVPDSVAWLGFLWSPTLDPSTGALDALIASGRLARIENQELRGMLAGLNDQFADAQQEDLLAERITLDHVLPHLRGAEMLRSLRRVTTDFVLAGQRAGATPQEASDELALPSYGSVRVPNDPALLAALTFRLVWYISATGELGALLEHLDDLDGLMSAELDSW